MEIKYIHSNIVTSQTHGFLVGQLSSKAWRLDLCCDYQVMARILIRNEQHKVDTIL